MRRRLITLALVLSLLLLVGTAMLWARGQHSTDYVWTNPDRAADGHHVWGGMTNLQNAIYFWLEPPVGHLDLNIHTDDFGLPDESDASFRTWHGFGLTRTRGCYGVQFPHWFLMICFGGMPAMWLIRSFRGPLAGQCHSCQYDLTGNTSGTCPECGAAIERKAGPAA